MKRFMVIFLMMIFTAAPLAAKDLTGTLQQIKETGKMRIGYRESEPPMSFAKDGKPAGYSIDICKCIVTEVKEKIGKDVSVEYVPVNSENRFQALEDNKIDILCGSTTKTLSRSELVDFTQLTFVTGASMLTLRDAKVKDIADFNGKKIGVVKDTTTEKALHGMLKETLTDAKIVLFDSGKEGLEAVVNKKIDAFSADQVVLIGLIVTAPEPDMFSVVSNVFSFEPFALALRRNDADFRLIADRVISHLYRSGQILPIYDKWFGMLSDKRPLMFDALFQLNATPE
jgi:ABC-type amino acid transport substrate-binding protein